MKQMLNCDQHWRTLTLGTESSRTVFTYSTVNSGSSSSMLLLTIPSSRATADSVEEIFSSDVDVVVASVEVVVGFIVVVLLLLFSFGVVTFTSVVIVGDDVVKVVDDDVVNVVDDVDMVVDVVKGLLSSVSSFSEFF